MFEHPPTSPEATKPEVIIEQSMGKIIPYAEFRQYHRKPPFSLELTSGDHELTFLGAGHTVDRNSPQFQIIRDGLTSFVERSKRPVEVFVEGLPKEGLSILQSRAGSRDPDALIPEGESVFTAALAESLGVEWDCPEPAEDVLIKAVLDKGYSKNELAAFYISRKLDYILRTKKSAPTFSELGNEIIRTETNVGMGWIPLPEKEALMAMYREKPTEFNQLVWSTGHMLADKFLDEFKQASGRDARGSDSPNDEALPLDADAISSSVDPTGASVEKNRLKEISALNTTERDKHIFQKIGHAVASGKNVYVVYGSGHLTTLEPALRDLWEKLIAKS